VDFEGWLRVARSKEIVGQPAIPRKSSHHLFRLLYPLLRLIVLWALSWDSPGRQHLQAQPKEQIIMPIPYSMMIE
jgi:hypothetical protein